MSYLIIGLAGTEISDTERSWLQRDEVGGVILFTRNYQSVDQLRILIGEIRSIDAESLICIDQEGGRVQRLKDGFSRLPALGKIGTIYQSDPSVARELAEKHAWLMASEMLAMGIDLSFAPVLDLDGISDVIGDRSFSSEPETVADLAIHYLKGLKRAGMASVGKHFPGHGSVKADTHHDCAIDQRSWAEIQSDLHPFKAGFEHQLDSVMMAHVSYPEVCSEAAGYSTHWIRDILRSRLSFSGVIFSDDLGMRAAEQAGDYQQRLDASLQAGCDFVLVCRPQDVTDAFAQITRWPKADRDRRRELRGQPAQSWTDLEQSTQRKQVQALIKQWIPENC